MKFYSESFQEDFIMELVIRTASGTIIAPWGRNLSQGRLHCDKFPPYYGFLGPELVTGAASL